jgi:hypothetical protein
MAIFNKLTRFSKNVLLLALGTVTSSGDLSAAFAGQPRQTAAFAATSANAPKPVSAEAERQYRLGWNSKKLPAEESRNGLSAYLPASQILAVFSPVRLYCSPLAAAAPFLILGNANITITEILFVIIALFSVGIYLCWRLYWKPKRLAWLAKNVAEKDRHKLANEDLSLIKIKEDGKKYTELDNKGSLQDTSSKATSYWIARMQSKEKAPFVLYTFSNESAAREALLQVPCIHVAEETKKLICEEVLYYGYYKVGDGQWEVILCGHNLTNELWTEARTAFIKHGGVRKNEQEPTQGNASVKSEPVGDASKVHFVREDGDSTATWRVHSAPNKADAMAFLEQHPVTKALHYIVVETPEGIYGRDKDGFYQE